VFRLRRSGTPGTLRSEQLQSSEIFIEKSIPNKPFRCLKNRRCEEGRVKNEKCGLSAAERPEHFRTLRNPSKNRLKIFVFFAFFAYFARHKTCVLSVTYNLHVMKKIFYAFLLVLLVLALAFFLGPKPEKPLYTNEFPMVSADPEQLEKWVTDRENTEKIKPDNEARFIWANDSVKGKTKYVLLYLHGFSASWFEGSPVNVDFARHFGCNAYFPRLAAHGLDTQEALLDMTPDRLWESAKEALTVARQLGEYVVIMSTSTGGTLALKLAAEFPDKICGLILFSPNVEINNSTAWLLSKPWGLQLARKSVGGNYRITNPDSTNRECQYWYCKYRLEGIVYLQQLVETTMNEEVFKKVTVPVFLGYYYKDETHQDKTVRVDAALRMFDQLGTPADIRVKMAFPEAGDHCIANSMFSKSVDEVRAASFAFAEKFIGMRVNQ